MSTANERLCAGIDILKRATPQLRWHQTKTGRSMTLQQLWVSDDAAAAEWRAVPIVVNGITVQKER